VEPKQGDAEAARLRGIENRKLLVGKLPSEWPPMEGEPVVNRRLLARVRAAIDDHKAGRITEGEFLAYLRRVA